MNKLPILGIDNAGKSSIILTFQRQFQVISDIKPTKGIHRIQLQMLDKELTIWDFGGQDKYREKYISNAEVNFSDVAIWFFVVDIQDHVRFPEVEDYFKVCVEHIQNYSPDAYLNLIMHKFDPGLENDEEFLNRTQEVENKLLSMSQPLKAKIYRTSIFHPMSVIHAFSKAVLGDTKLEDDLQNIFSNFLKSNFYEEIVDYILVYSNDFVELGSYMNPNVDPNVCKENATHFFSIFDSPGLKLDSAELFLESFGLKIYTKKSVLDRGKIYYFICGYHEERLENKTTFQEKLKKMQEDVQTLLLIF